MNIYKKMMTVTNKLETVEKNLSVGTGKNTYKAVGELDILNAVKPVEFECGIYSYPYSRKIIDSSILETENNGFVRKQMYMRVETIYRFVNVDNPDEYIDIVSYGDGIDTGDKATGKAMTYSDKYALMKAYKISTGEDPDQFASEELKSVKKTQTKTQAPKPQPQAPKPQAGASDLQIKIATIIDFVKEHPKFKTVVEGVAKNNGVSKLTEIPKDDIEQLYSMCLTSANSFK